MPGLNFIDNRYYWDDRSPMQITGFIPLDRREDTFSAERQLVLKAVQEAGAQWYTPSNDNLKYITDKYNIK